MTGEFISAQEAYRIGLTNRVFPHDQFMAGVKELAERIARGPSVAISLIKKAVNMGVTHSLEEQIELEASYNVICHKTTDYAEGVKSFFEKREPVFRGR